MAQTRLPATLTRFRQPQDSVAVLTDRQQVLGHALIVVTWSRCERQPFCVLVVVIYLVIRLCLLAYLLQPAVVVVTVAIVTTMKMMMVMAIVVVVAATTKTMITTVILWGKPSVRII